MARNCINCGSQINDAAKFCPKCGKAAAAQSEPHMLICSNCSAQLNVTAKFCPKCGKAVAGAAPIGQQPAAPQPYIQSPVPQTGGEPAVTQQYVQAPAAQTGGEPAASRQYVPAPAAQTGGEPAAPRQYIQAPAAQTGGEQTTPQKRISPRAALTNALLFLTALGLLFLNIRVVPEKIKEASVSPSPIEENVLTDEVQAEYNILASGGTLLGKEASEDNNMPRNDYSRIAGEDGDKEGE